MGTLPYMAPEQVQGLEADAQDDIWALGDNPLRDDHRHACLSRASTAVSLIGAILERGPAPLASHQPLTPSSLDWTVRRCLAKHPDDRWDSARDVVAQLR